jgi:hypothetical protein
MTPKPTQRRVEEEVASTKIVGTFARLNVLTSKRRERGRTLRVASPRPRLRKQKADPSPPFARNRNWARDDTLEEVASG